MAGAFVQIAQNSTTSAAAASVAAAFGSNNTSGNFIFATIGFDANSGNGTKPTFTLTDSAGNTYTLIDSLWDPVTQGGEYSAIYYAQGIAGSANTVTATVTNQGSLAGGYYVAVSASEYSGVATSGAFTAGEFAAQNQNGAPTSTNGVTSGNTPTLSSANKLVISFTTIKHALQGTTWLSSGTGYTSDATFWSYQFAGNIFAGIEHQNVSSNAAIAGTWTASAGGNMDTHVAAFNLTSTTQNGSGAITAQADVAAGTGTIKILGSGAITAQPDTAAGTGTVTILGTGAITAANDSVIGVGTGGGGGPAPIPPETGMGLTLFRLGGHR